MPFFIGLLLAPVGGVIGTIVMAIGLVQRMHPPGLQNLPSKLTPGLWDMLGVIALFGPVGGTLHALPVSLGVLPLAYLLLRRFSWFGAKALAAIGVVSGGLAVFAFHAHELMKSEGVHHVMIWQGIRERMYAGAIAGAALGLIYARIMAWYGRALSETRS